jgi:hypothetical protein
VHPVIRLAGFVALCALLARAVWIQVFAAAVLLGLLYHLADVPLYASLAALKRLRWLLLSIALVHLAFTPGAPLFPGLAALPTLEGLEEGLLRAALLILLMLAAHLVLHSTPREALLAALLWLSAPLARRARERLALRVMLTLHAVTEVQGLMGAAEPDQRGRPLARITQRASRLWVNVLQRAESAPCVTLDIPACGAPPLRQWLYLLAAGTLFWALGTP